MKQFKTQTSKQNITRVILIGLFCISFLGLGIYIGTLNEMNIYLNIPINNTANNNDGDLVVRSDRNIQASHTEFDYQYNPDSGKLVISNVFLSNIVGDSMQPIFFTENNLILEKYTNQQLHEGMMIRYSDGNGGYICHTLMAIYDDYIITEGIHYGNRQKVLYDDIDSIVIGVLYT